MNKIKLNANEVLVLKRCKDGSIAAKNFVYPARGVVEAGDWNDKKVCGGGLHGWTLGFENYADTSLAGNFIVIKVDKRDGYVEMYGMVKFRKGVVILNTQNAHEAHELMLSVYPTMKLHWSTSNQGAVSTSNQGNWSTSNQGASSTSNQGYWSTSNQGAVSTSSQGDGSTSNQGASSTSNQGAVSTSNQGNWSTSNQGNWSTSNQGDGSTSNQGCGSTSNQGDWSTSNQGDWSTSSQGDGSTSNQGASSVAVHRFQSKSSAIVRFANNSVAVLFDDSGKPSVYQYNNRTVYFYDTKPVKMYAHTPNVTSLDTHEVFVFGSNLAGNHAGGAAKLAVKFGAQHGVGEGLAGQSYAFPTLGMNMEQRTETELRESVDKLLKCAAENTGKIFLLTKVGCGIAGYDEEFMKSLFTKTHGNIVKPKGW